MSDSSQMSSTPSSGAIRTFASLKRGRLWLLVGAVALAGVLGLILWMISGKGDKQAPVMTACAERGPLVVRVIESGEVEAERRDVIANDSHWPVYIVSVVSDGTQVKKGDLIVQFECKELADAITQQRITVTMASNDFTEASENAQMKQKEVEYNVYKAQQDEATAKENVLRYEEGEWPTLLDKAKSDIQLAQRDLTLAEGKLEFKKKANADPELNKPYSESEIQADELALTRLKIAVTKAQSDRDMLEKYDHPQKVRQLKLAVRDSGLSLEKSQTEAKTQMMVARANVESKQATLKAQESKLTDLLTEDAKLTVKAARDGLVVYNTANRWGGQTPLVVEVGTKLDPRQQIMIIPDMTSLQIKTRVYEAMIDQVQKGAEAYIRLDAKPDKILTGKIAKVAPLPDNQNWMNPTAKVYNVYVKFDQPIDGLKPNMTAQTELILARLPSVLSVPVAAVFASQEQRYCIRSSGGRCQRVPITTGRLSETRVEVLSGLREGDVVLLNPPQEMIEQDKPKDKMPQTAPAPVPDTGRKEIAHP